MSYGWATLSSPSSTVCSACACLIRAIPLRLRDAAGSSATCEEPRQMVLLEPWSGCNYWRSGRRSLWNSDLLDGRSAARNRTPLDRAHYVAPYGQCPDDVCADWDGDRPRIGRSFPSQTSQTTDHDLRGGAAPR